MRFGSDVDKLDREFDMVYAHPMRRDRMIRQIIENTTTARGVIQEESSEEMSLSSIPGT